MANNFKLKNDEYEYILTDEFFEEDEWNSEEEKYYRKVKEKEFIKNFLTKQKGYELDWRQY